MRIELGAYGRLHLRVERLPGPAPGGRWLFASDLHLSGGWTRRPTRQLVELARDARPDAILLGGDLVDAPCGLPLLARLVGDLVRVAPVWVRRGNHDAWAERWMAPGRLTRTVERAGGRWLPGTVGGVPVDIAPEDDGASRVLCAHSPAVFDDAAARGYPLVLAGHLHGGQVVLARHDGRWYPGAWGATYTGPRFERDGSRLLVSAGVNDTLPLRYDCPRDAVLCVFD